MIGYRAVGTEYSTWENGRENGVNAIIHGPVAGVGMRFQNGRARAAYSVQHSPRLCHVELAGSGLWRLSSTMTKISYGGYRFAPEIIQQAIWLYLRFTLSFRDVEDWLAERGIVVSYETVRQWVNHFGPMIAADLGRRRPKPRRKFASTTTFGRSRVRVH